MNIFYGDDMKSRFSLEFLWTTERDNARLIETRDGNDEFVGYLIDCRNQSIVIENNDDYKDVVEKMKCAGVRIISFDEAMEMVLKFALEYKAKRINS
jgi:hypothetical protein